MTKLMQWLLIGIITSSIWIGVLVNKTESEIEWYHKWFPVIVVFFFGLYAATVVLYRTFTFNNCESAAVELQKQIKEAKEDLKAKGIKFKN